LVFTVTRDEGLFNGLILLGEISKRTTPLLLAFLIKATTSIERKYIFYFS
jgi:hypothetical protein